MKVLRTYKIDPDLYKEVQHIAEQRGQSVNGIISSTLERYVLDNIKYLSDAR
jgi:vacuolar-type H+-ATPase subunit C/Vma6